LTQISVNFSLALEFVYLEQISFS